MSLCLITHTTPSGWITVCIWRAISLTSASAHHLSLSLSLCVCVCVCVCQCVSFTRVRAECLDRDHWCATRLSLQNANISGLGETQQDWRHALKMRRKRERDRKRESITGRKKLAEKREKHLEKERKEERQMWQRKNRKKEVLIGLLLFNDIKALFFAVQKRLPFMRGFNYQRSLQMFSVVKGGCAWKWFRNHWRGQMYKPP